MGHVCNRWQTFYLKSRKSICEYLNQKVTFPNHISRSFLYSITAGPFTQNGSSNVVTDILLPLNLEDYSTSVLYALNMLKSFSSKVVMIDRMEMLQDG